jgi:hypothetical protein
LFVTALLPAFPPPFRWVEKFAIGGPFQPWLLLVWATGIFWLLKREDRLKRPDIGVPVLGFVNGRGPDNRFVVLRIRNQGAVAGFNGRYILRGPDWDNRVSSYSVGRDRSFQVDWRLDRDSREIP